MAKNISFPSKPATAIPIKTGARILHRLWNGGNGKGTVKLYRGKKLIDEVICENVECEYGEYGIQEVDKFAD